MSLKTFLVSIEETALGALKAAGTVVESFVISEAQRLVAAAKATPLGTLALSLIQIFEGHDMTGEQKMASVIGALVPAITAAAATGGIPAIEGSVEDFAREFAQSAYNDLQADLAKVAAGAAAPAS